MRILTTDDNHGVCDVHVSGKAMPVDGFGKHSNARDAPHGSSCFLQMTSERVIRLHKAATTGHVQKGIQTYVQ